MVEMSNQPGAAWLAIVTRQTIQDFASAFCGTPVLEATVLPAPLIGTGAIYEFFRATRSMYDRIQFVQEMRSFTRICLEWEGQFQSREISGATILTYGAGGAIDRIRLFHHPLEQLNAFSAELERQRSMKAESNNNFNGVHHEN